MEIDGLENAMIFLETKLSEFSDKISIERFNDLYRIDKYGKMIASAIEYAKDLNVDIENTHALNDLIVSVGGKIDEILYVLNQSKEETDECEKLKIILRDLQIVHFGLIGILLVKMEFVDVDKIIRERAS